MSNLTTGGRPPSAPASDQARFASRSALGAEAAALDPLAQATEVLQAGRIIRRNLDGVYDLAAFRRALAEHPTKAQLTAAEADLRTALQAKPDDRQNRFFLALLIETFWSQTARAGDPGAFIEIVIADLHRAGHPPIVFAHALRDLRKAKFMPTLGEILDACDQAAQVLKRTLESFDWSGKELDSLGRTAERLASRASGEMR